MCGDERSTTRESGSPFDRGDRGVRGGLVPGARPPCAGRRDCPDGGQRDDSISRFRRRGPYSQTDVFKLLPAPTLEFVLPEGVLTGVAAFREWYDDVIGLFFDEVHSLTEVRLTGKRGEIVGAKVLVNWQARRWRAAAAAQRVDRFRCRPGLGDGALGRDWPAGHHPLRSERTASDAGIAGAVNRKTTNDSRRRRQTWQTETAATLTWRW